MHYTCTYYISLLYAVQVHTSEKAVQEKETDVKEVTSSNEAVITDKGNEAQGPETIEQDSTMHFDVVMTLNDKKTESEQLLRKANGESESKGKVINKEEEDQTKMMESRPTEILLTPSEKKPIRQKSNKATEDNTNNVGINADDSIPLEESLNASVDWETCDEELSDSSDTSDEDELDDDVIEKRTNTEEDDESSDHEVILKESTIGTDSIDRKVAPLERESSIEEAGKTDNSEGNKESRTDESTGIGVASADCISEWETFQEDKEDHNISDEEIVFRMESCETTNPDVCETNENKSSSEDSSIHSDVKDDMSRLEAAKIQEADQSSEWETFEEEKENHSPTAEDEEVVLKTKPNNALSLHVQGTDGIKGDVAEKAFSKEAEFQHSAQSIYTETFEQEKEDSSDSLTEKKEMENNSGDKQRKDNIQADDHTEKDERCSGKQIQTDYFNVLNTTTDWETCDESDTSCDSTEDINEDINKDKADNEDDDTEEGRNSENTSNEYREKDKNIVMDRSSEWETFDESDTSCDSTDEINEKKTASEDKADDEVEAEETDKIQNALKNHKDKEEQKSLNISSDWETCESDTSCDTTGETNDKVGESEEAAIESEQSERTNTIKRNDDERTIVNTSSDWETVNESHTSCSTTDDIYEKSTIDTDREKTIDKMVLDLEKSQLVVKEAEGHESKEHQCLKTVSKQLIKDEKVQEVNENSNKNNTDQSHNRDEKSDGSRIGKDPECRGMILSNAFKNDLSEEWQCLRQTMLCSLQFYTEERFSAKLLHPSPCFNLLFNALLW